MSFLTLGQGWRYEDAHDRHRRTLPPARAARGRGAREPVGTAEGVMAKSRAVLFCLLIS